MKINIEDIPENGLELNFTGNQDILTDALENIPNQDGITIKPQVKGWLRVANTEDGALVSGEVQTTAILNCSRCLEKYEFEKDLEIAVLVRSHDKASAEVYDDDEADGSFLIVGSEFDPGVLIVQEFFLEIPMKSLCALDCPGLCPNCGLPKVSGHCSCEPTQTMDPRWLKLAGLKKKLEDSDGSE